MLSEQINLHSRKDLTQADSNSETKNAKSIHTPANIYGPQ